MKPVKGWQFPFTAWDEATHAFYTKFGQDFPSIFITMHFQKGPYTLLRASRDGEKKAQVVPELF